MVEMDFLFENGVRFHRVFGKAKMQPGNLFVAWPTEDPDPNAVMGIKLKIDEEFPANVDPTTVSAVFVRQKDMEKARELIAKHVGPHK